MALTFLLGILWVLSKCIFLWIWVTKYQISNSCNRHISSEFKHWSSRKVQNIRMQLLIHPFNGLFSRTTWVSRHQKGKPFWILLEQEMTVWRWHQLDHMQIICTSLQTDNHASTSPLSFFTGQIPFLPTNQQRQSTQGKIYACKRLKTRRETRWNLQGAPNYRTDLSRMWAEVHHTMGTCGGDIAAWQVFFFDCRYVP